ncbi:MAG: cation transporter [Bacteroidota bacterium]
MKKYSLSIIAFLFLVLALPAISFAQKTKNTQTTVIKTKIYCDHCKQCETCGDKFNKDLYNEDGIKRVEVDAKANTITVVYDTRKTDLNKIKVLISKLGYDADEVKADPAGVAKLDGCCKK